MVSGDRHICTRYLKFTYLTSHYFDDATFLKICPILSLIYFIKSHSDLINLTHILLKFQSDRLPSILIKSAIYKVRARFD